MSEAIYVEMGEYKLNQRNEFHTYDLLRKIVDNFMDNIQ